MWTANLTATVKFHVRYIYAKFRLNDTTSNYSVLPSDSPDDIRKVYPVSLGMVPFRTQKIVAEPLIQFVYMKIKSILQINRLITNKDEYFNT
jgi:hypothetical protein